MNSGRKFDVKMFVVLAMLSAVAYILASLIRIPLVPAVGFLGYEPKDVVLVIAGFIYGPVAPLVMAVVISLLEGVTTSVLGPVGIPMNFIASVSFACTASFIYKKRKTIAGAGIGLGVGVIVTTVVMLLWNYALTPILMGMPRAAVVQLLVPGFLPFNIIKGALNASIALLLYKPVRKALGRSGLLPVSGDSKAARASKVSVGVILVALFVILTCAFVVLSWQGVI